MYHIVLSLSIVLFHVNGDSDFICDNTRFDPHNDTWVLCNMFRNISQLYQEYSWFSHTAPDPCGDEWTFINCTYDNDLNQTRITSIGDFNKIGDSNQSINTTYWPEKMVNFEFNFATFGGILNFDNLSKELEMIRIEMSGELVLNFEDMTDLSNFTNLKTFFFANWKWIDSDILMNKLPIDNLEVLSMGRNHWYTFPNVTKFTQLKFLNLGSAQFHDESTLEHVVLPKNIEHLKLRDTDLTGHLNFLTLMPDSPNLKRYFLKR